MVIRALLAILVLPSTLDALFRILLVASSSRRSRHAGEAAGPVSKWLVIVPSRGEGAHVSTTVKSVCGSGADNVRTVVILDGEDPEAARSLRGMDAVVRTKTPAGPSKAAALRWLRATHPEDVTQADAILILDVGSEVGPDFFRKFRWRASAAASQASLRGRAEGVGRAAAASERASQVYEDRGRESLGWSVRLRGTGTVLRPDAFCALLPLLRTQTEDEEATLVLASLGYRSDLADVAVIDDKPATHGELSKQRARWIVGRFQILTAHWRAASRLLRRRPAEGFAALMALFGRPLSLTILLRLVVGAALLVLSLDPWQLMGVVFASTSIITAFTDVAFIARSGVRVSDAISLFWSWLLALLMTPRAVARWMKIDRR